MINKNLIGLPFVYSYFYIQKFVLTHLKRCSEIDINSWLTDNLTYY